MTETVDAGALHISGTTAIIPLSEVPYLGKATTEASNAEPEDFAYVMLIKDGEIISEPYIPKHNETEGPAGPDKNVKGDKNIEITIQADDQSTFDSVLVDYYVARKSGAQQIEITADKFGGNYYLEASTLFRTTDGVDMPAEFIIPNCKIQSNFTFSMASSGDPSTFTFTLDAFPDYTRFDHTKKVLATIQMIDANSTSEEYRKATPHATAPAGSTGSQG